MPHKPHICYFLRGIRRAKSSAMSMSGMKRTPGRSLMY
jgi:hypothetical protein